MNDFGQRYITLTKYLHSYLHNGGGASGSHGEVVPLQVKHQSNIIFYSIPKQLYFEVDISFLLKAKHASHYIVKRPLRNKTDKKELLGCSVVLDILSENHDYIRYTMFDAIKRIRLSVLPKTKVRCYRSVYDILTNTYFIKPATGLVNVIPTFIRDVATLFLVPIFTKCRDFAFTPTANIKSITCIVEELHKRNCFYCDMKKGNIMSRADDTLVLVDYGSIKLFPSEILNNHYALHKSSLTYMELGATIPSPFVLHFSILMDDMDWFMSVTDDFGHVNSIRMRYILYLIQQSTNSSLSSIKSMLKNWMHRFRRTDTNLTVRDVMVSHDYFVIGLLFPAFYNMYTAHPYYYIASHQQRPASSA